LHDLQNQALVFATILISTDGAASFCRAQQLSQDALVVHVQASQAIPLGEGQGTTRMAAGFQKFKSSVQ
jgi:hypothetical protein